MKAYKSILILLLGLTSCNIFTGPDPSSDPIGIFNRIWKDFDETYALIDLKMGQLTPPTTWNDEYTKYSARISPGMGDETLFQVCCDMLKDLNDSHVYLLSPFRAFNSGGRFDTANNEPFSLQVIKNNYLAESGTATPDGMFVYGTFTAKPTIGYIYIAGFAKGETEIGSQDWVKAIDSIINSLSSTTALIVDIRGNRGGLQANVDYIANRFASAERDYVEVRTKNGTGRNDFSSSITHTIKPEGTRYTKPIILLTNKQTISGGEWFTLALRSQPHVTHAGSTSAGAFSLSLERQLANGWIYSVSVQKVTDMDGACYEGVGIAPPILTANSAVNIASNIDDQLGNALTLVP
ncbi:MAG: S41 family peptidase [Treponema sp.]|jgi:C-terminal processing protease CtpA/Prc|nr:S41 family peptidase [Treponema sp.]